MVQTQTMYETYQGALELLKIFLVKGNAKYPICEASAVVVAESAEDVYDMVSTEIYEIETIHFIGYADIVYTDPEILLLNNGEYINKNINN